MNNQMMRVAIFSNEQNSKTEGDININEVMFHTKCSCGKMTVTKATDIVDHDWKRRLLKMFGVFLENGVHRCYCMVIHQCSNCDTQSNGKKKIEFFGICRCGETVNITAELSQIEKRNCQDKQGTVEENGKVICRYKPSIPSCPNCAGS